MALRRLLPRSVAHHLLLCYVSCRRCHRLLQGRALVCCGTTTSASSPSSCSTCHASAACRSADSGCPDGSVGFSLTLVLGTHLQYLFVVGRPAGSDAGVQFSMTLNGERWFRYAVGSPFSGQVASSRLSIMHCCPAVAGVVMSAAGDVAVASGSESLTVSFTSSAIPADATFKYRLYRRGQALPAAGDTGAPADERMVDRSAETTAVCKG